MSVDRGHRGSRATSPLLSSMAIGLLLAVCSAPLAPAPGAAASFQEADTEAVTLVAAPADAGLVRQGTMLSVRVTVRNGTEQVLPAGEVVLSLDSGRATGQELASWFAEDAPLALDRAVARDTVRSLEPGSVAVLDLRVEAGELGTDTRSGPRRALVELRADGEMLAADPTAVVWLASGDPLPTGRSAIVVPLSTPGVPAALLSSQQLARLTAEGGSLTRTLDAASEHDVTLALDPRIVASTRILGDDAPPSALDLLDRLANSAIDSFALGWADADPALPSLAGGAPLAPPDRAPGGDTSSTLEELAAWAHSTTAVVWPSGPAISDEALVSLIESGARTVLAPSSRLSGDGPLLSLEGSRVLSVDSALSAALAEAASARSTQAWTSAVAQASALLAAAASDGRDLVGAVDRDASSALRLSDLLDALDALPWRAPAALSSLLQGTPSGEASVIEAPVDDALTATASSALAAEDADRAFASIAADSEALVAERRLELLASTSPGWGPDRISALGEFVASSERLRSSVQVVDSSPILLLTDRTSVPITIQNSLDAPVTVFVSVSPATGQLRVLDQRVEVTLEPESSAQALVPVQSLTNGTVDITVSLRDAEGRTVGASTSFELNLQAGWETAGTIAIAAVIALLFAIGIARNVRKRRRRRLAVTGDETADTP
ncbi:MAG: DUF6049 family protein [Microcella sp.]|uniref:DUF6049 family protein n=1 Tax=Microcella sp. TaxID=1913979 RepID=UPI00331471B2